MALAVNRIYVDIDLPASAFARLREGVGAIEILRPRSGGVSVLSAGPADPALNEADVAFGQPPVDGLLQAPRLRWVHIASSGITRYDRPECWTALRQKGVAFTHSPTVYAAPCADHLLAFMLAQSRLLPLALASRCPIGSPEWHALRGGSVPLSQQRAVIVGFGAIGKRLIRLLQPFDMRLVACRRRARGDEGVPVVSPEALDATLAESDHVINILPDNPHTRGFFNAARFQAIRPGAVYYNIGRGTTTDQKALATALRSGRLRAAWLDVTDPEPLPDDHPLRSQPNCYITPHIAGGFAGEAEALVDHFLENLRRFISGAPMLDRVV